MTKANHLFEMMVNTLLQKYPINESKAISYLYFSHVLNITKVDIVAKKELVWNEKKQNMLDVHQNKLAMGTPVQYILGHITIDELSLSVNQDVLIPRPETEELVKIVVKAEKDATKLNILDIGTGSGYIAIALAKSIAKSKVVAWDCSLAALKVAKKNAIINNIDIDIDEVDVLNKNVKIPQYIDIIVCNPPYIPLSEKHQMDDNVVCHEPHLALFVPDEDPLLYYRAILELVLRPYNNVRTLYFEVHSPLAKETKVLFNKHYCCQLKNDIFGKLRFLVVNVQ